MKRSVLGLLLLLVAVLIAWRGLALLGAPDPEEIGRDREDEQAGPLLEEASPGEPSTAEGPTLAGDPDAASAPSATVPPTPDAAGTPVPPPADDAVAVYTGEVPPGWHEAEPAQRPHAIRPPRPRGPRMGGGPAPGGFGPTGHWSRFPPPPPPQGDAAIRVSVLDETGARVSGADVLLGPRESLGQEAVSFGDLRRIGATDARGELLVEDLPAGAAVLAANVANLLNGPRGLDMRSAIPVLLVDHATVRAVVRLPLDLDAFGRVAGRVVDAKGRPVARAEIRCGFIRTYANGEGAFELPNLPAGTQSVSARRTGYAVASEEVDVPRGGTREVEIVLAWRESGALRLEGRVYDATGAALPGATIHLIDEAGRGTLRSVISDADGRYVFEDLPERLRESPVRVQADRSRDGYRATNVRLDTGIRDPVLDLHLPPQQVKVRFLLREAGSGSPVTRCRVEVEPLSESQVARGFTGSNAGGAFEHWYPEGRYRFRVEAPERETQVVEADLTPPGGAVELEVRFPGVGEAAVQVTLRVRVDDQTTGAAVAKVVIVLEDEKGDEVARLDGSASDGIYSLPAPSGRHVLRVTAPGYETQEEPVDLPADPPETDVTIHLRPE